AATPVDSRRIASTSAFSCAGGGDTAARTITVNPVKQGVHYKLDVRYKYVGGGDDYAFTADWVHPPLGSDPKQVIFEYSSNDYAGYSVTLTVPNDELVAGAIQNVQIFEGADPVKGKSGQGSLNCKLQH
ncbi:MAG: hypothetical protein ACXVA8_11690, partial [Bdellovibrionota bacterium]